MRIAVDVDLTVVDIVADWLKWMNSLTNRSLTVRDCGYQYNLGQFFKEDLKKFDLCPFDFWRMAGIYDTAKPFVDALHVLPRLAEKHDIVFVSKIMGNHGESKKMFLNRFFPFNKGIVFTDDKHLVSCDIIVDDRVDFLDQFGDNVHKLLIYSEFSQTRPMTSDIKQVTDWYEIKKYIEGELLEHI